MENILFAISGFNWIEQRKCCKGPNVFVGRIHSAIVAAINNENRCATVEWFEQGETKGKEVDMTAIESLNPEVIILKPGEDPKFNKLQRVSTFLADQRFVMFIVSCK